MKEEAPNKNKDSGKRNGMKCSNTQCRVQSWRLTSRTSAIR